MRRLAKMVRRLAKWVAARLGYELRRIRIDRNDVVAQTLPDSEYYARWSTPYSLFAPWLGHPELRPVLNGSVQEHSLLTADRLYYVAKLAGQASFLQGDMAECGVYRGGTALLLGRVIAGKGKRLYLFDSFEGLPAGDPVKDAFLEEKRFNETTADSVERLLREFDDFTEIRQGWIPETFTGLEDRRYAFTHIDIDMYQSALDCCEYFYPRVVPGGVLLFDDYGFPTCRGERQAVDEFFADKRESPIALPTGQAIVSKLAEATP